MKRQIRIVLLLPLVLSAGTLAASAQPAGQQASSPPAAPTAGFRAEFLRELGGIEQRFISLAEMIPADKYNWRPGAGVRSVSEVFMHVAGANYNLPRLIGTPPPAGFRPQGFDTSVTDKAKVLEALRQSFDHLRRAALNVSDADSDKTLDWMGGKNTYRGMLLFMTRHLGEHLGQAIAYARLNNVVPPWTEERQRQQRQQQQQPPQPAARPMP